MNKQRILYLDALRLLATFAVIFIHISSPGHRIFLNADNLCAEGNNMLCLSKLITYSVYNKLSHWAVPMFLMISGAVFLRPDKEVTIKSVFHKLIPRLAVPYFFWWFFYSMVFCVLHWASKESMGSGWLAPYSHLWFLPMLMGVYLIIPFLKTISASQNLMRYFLALWVIFTLLESFPYVNVIYDSMCIKFVMGYSGYFMLGYFLSTTEFNARKRKAVYILGITAALAAVLVDVLGKLYSISVLNSNAPLMMAISTALFVWFKQMDWSTRATLLNKMQPYLFGIYLIHALFVLVFIKEPLYGIMHPVLYVPLAVVVVFFISYGCVWVLHRLPYLKRVVE